MTAASTSNSTSKSGIGEITCLLQQIDQGSEQARQELVELAYDELRCVAGGMMKRERPDHTWQATELVHEAAIRMLDGNLIAKASDRNHFFGVMVTAMRHVLVDHARSASSQRRGGGKVSNGIGDWLQQIGHEDNFDIVELDEALDELATINVRQKDVVMLRFFGGLTVPEIAGHLSCSVSTAEKDWRVARAWLRRRLGD